MNKKYNHKLIPAKRWLQEIDLSPKYNLNYDLIHMPTLTYGPQCLEHLKSKGQDLIGHHSQKKPQLKRLTLKEQTREGRCNA